MPKGIEEQKLDSLIAIAHAAIDEFTAEEVYRVDVEQAAQTTESYSALQMARAKRRLAVQKCFAIHQKTKKQPKV